MSGFSQKRARLRRFLGRASLVAALVGVLSYPNVNQAHGGGSSPKPSKLDRVLHKAAARKDASPQRVIVRARPGRASAVADRLAKHGDRIEANHGRLDAMTATIHGDDLSALEADPDVEAVSVDAILYAGRRTGAGTDDGQARKRARRRSRIDEEPVQRRQGRHRGHRLWPREERRSLRRAGRSFLSISPARAAMVIPLTTTATARTSRR